MPPAKLLRWTGPVAVLAGLWTMGLPLIEIDQQAQAWIYAVGTILLIFSLLGVYAVQLVESGLPGLAGFVLAIIGEVFMMVEGNPQDPTGMLAGGLYAVGLIALTVGTWRARVFSRLIPGLWIVAIVTGLPGYAIPSLSQTLLIGASVAFGLGFITAGYELWMQRAARTAGR